MAHRQWTMVTLLRWCSWAGAWFEVPASTYCGGGSFCSSSKWWILLFLQRLVRTVQTCYAAVTCTHSANSADDCRVFSGAALGPVFVMPVVVQRHMPPSQEAAGRSRGTDGSMVALGVGAALFWLLRGKSGPGWCFLLLVYPLTQWLGGAAGAGCARVLPVSHGGLWKNFLFRVVASSRNSHLESVHYFRVLVSGSHCSGRLGVAYEFENWIFGRCLLSRVQCSVRQWIHVLRGLWKNLHIFYDAVNLNPEAFHSRCFGLQVRLGRLARWNLDTISTSSPFLSVCGNCRCSVQLEPSKLKSSSSSRAPCKLVSVTLQRWSFVVIHISHLNRL